MNNQWKKFVIPVLVHFVFWGIPTLSIAGPNISKLLMGDYSLVSTLSCATSPSGFDADLIRIGNGGSYNAHVTGILSFDGNGNGSFDGDVLVLDHAQAGDGMVPLTPATVTSEFTYTVNTNESFNIDQVSTVTRTGGTQIGLVTIVDNILTEGQIGSQRNILVMGDTKPNVEVITFPNGSTVDRICGRSVIAIKIR